MVVTSAAEPELRAILGNWPHIDLCSSVQYPKQLKGSLATDIEQEVLELLHNCPSLRNSERAIVEKLSSCRQNEHLRHLIRNQLQRLGKLSVEAAVKSEVSITLSKDPTEMTAQIMSITYHCRGDPGLGLSLDGFYSASAL